METDSFEYRGTELRNIVGKLGGGPIVIVAAHYDTRRIADNDPSPELRGQPLVGANDGASGVAVLLELARVTNVASAGHEVWLEFFDAEDQGGAAGWDWFVGPTRVAARLAREPTKEFDGLVLLDMVGGRQQRVCRAAESTRALADSVFEAASSLGYAQWLPADCTYSVSDDHTPFLERRLPAVDLIDFDYPYWHTHADTCDKIAAASLQRVGRTVETRLEAGAKW